MSDTGKIIALAKAVTSPLSGAIQGKYTKPNDGIPTTDLASGVQTSLGKADTAYQKPQNGIPATDLASGVIPTVHNVPAGGTSGQVLAKSSGTDYALEWANPVNPSDAQAETYINAWLDDHPDATTTVQDGSITKAKLHSTLAQELDGKAPAIIVDSDAVSNHENMGTSSYPVNIIAATETTFGDVIYADGINLLDLSKCNAKTSGGVTVTPLKNNSFKLNGKATSATAYDFDIIPDNASDIPTVGEICLCKVFTTIKADMNIYVLRENDTPYEIKSTVVSTLNELINRTVYETVPANAKGLRLRLFTESGTTYDNDITWVGLYHAGTTFTTLGASSTLPVETTLSIDKFNTLYYPSIVQEVADTKTYIDALDIDINEKLTYITPEKFYGGMIPSNVDASSYIMSAINYGRDNGVAVRCNRTYKITSMLDLQCSMTDIFINKLIYTGNTDYAIRLRGQFNKLHIISILANNAGGISFHAVGSSAGEFTTANQVDVGRIESSGHCIAFTKPSGTTITVGLNSLNIITCKSLISTTGNGIYTESGSGCCENVFYGGEIHTSADYAMHLEAGGNAFHDFTLEETAYQGLYLECGGNRLHNFRTRECEDRCGLMKRPWMKLKGIVVNNVFYDRYPFPTNIDVSELVVPPEDYGGAAAGELYPFYVSQPAVYVSNYRTTKSSYYNDMDAYWYDIGPWAYNLEGKLICKPQKPGMMTVTSATVDMNETNEVTYFEIASVNTEITLSSSYCADGIDEIIVEQKNGYYATLVDEAENEIFDGSSYGDGLYKIQFIAQRVTFTPQVGMTMTAWFFGKNSKAVITKLEQPTSVS